MENVGNDGGGDAGEVSGAGEGSGAGNIVQSEPFVLERYASTYSHRTKIKRLLFIAEKCSNGKDESMELNALKLAHDEAKKRNIGDMYRDVVYKISGRLGEAYELDSAWYDVVDGHSWYDRKKYLQQTKEYLDEDLDERRRLEALEFGHYLICRGDLIDAYKAYTDVLPLCELPHDALTVLFLLIEVKFEAGKISDIDNIVKDAENLPDIEWDDDEAVALLRIASGLAHLEAKNYKTVALKFLDISSEMVTKNFWSDFTSPQDVATYVGLCALATFDREELKNKIIDNLNFQTFLVLVPVVRALIHDFYSSHYGNCLRYLANLKENLMFDLYFHDHVDTLDEKIKARIDSDKKILGCEENTPVRSDP